MSRHEVIPLGLGTQRSEVPLRKEVCETEFHINTVPKQSLGTRSKQKDKSILAKLFYFKYPIMDSDNLQK